MRPLIKKYIDDRNDDIRRNSYTDQNTIRRNFFSQIEHHYQQGKLTPVSLTAYIESQKDTASTIFPDLHCNETRLLRQLYAHLGVHLSNEDLQKIIVGQLDERRQKQLLHPIVSKYYQYKNNRIFTPFGNVDDINVAKRDFAKEIIDALHSNQLTVSSLTDKLAQLKPETRKLIFHRSLSFGASTKSEAAQLIKQVYAQLGVTISRQDCQHIVYGKLNQERNKITYSQKLKDAPYRQWLEQPYSKSARNTLEHELKGQLGLNSRETILLTLAEAITAGASKSSNQQQKLVEYFTQILQYAPEFLTDVINDLRDQHLNDLVALYFEPSLDPQLKKHLLQSHADIAEAAVKRDSTIFSELNPEMKREVFQRFLNNPDDKQLVKDINERAGGKIKRVTGANNLDDAYYTIYDYKNSTNASRLDCPLRITIYNKVEKNILPFINRENAIVRIHRYLRSNPSQYKHAFFQRLSNEIEENGLSVGGLEAALKQAKVLKLFNTATPESFFHKPEDCGSLACMLDLYKLATGKILSKNEKKQLLNPKNAGNRFPTQSENEIAEFRNQKVTEAIQQTLMDPATAEYTRLGQHIQGIVDELKSDCNVLTQTEHRSKSLKEAKRQQQILTLAVQQADGNARLDPQGHMLLEVEYESKTIFCSIDMIGIGGLWRKFVDDMKDQSALDQEQYSIQKKNSFSLMQKVNQQALNNAVDALVRNPSRGSIIPLQEEIEFHMRLLSRVIEKLDTGNVISADKWKAIRLMAAKKLEFRVKYFFQHALVDAYIKGTDNKPASIDIAKLNKALDQERKELANFCQEVLFEAMNDNNAGIGSDQFRKLYYDKLKGNLIKRHFTSTTATGEDYLRTNNRNQTISQTAKTDRTAHKKSAGQAFRPIHRNRLAPNDKNILTVIPYKQATTESRVPSIAVKKSDHNDSMKDIAKKLKEDYEALQLEAFSQGPMIYNLFTSFVSKPEEWFTFGFWTPPHRKNRQRLSAARILKGSHVFNRQQVIAGNIHSLCYVQNIPINQHGNNICYDSWDSARREALLMSDLAILSTLHHHAAQLPPNLRFTVADHFKKMHGLYTHFLKHQDMGDRYFNDSIEGKGAIQLMKTFKSRVGYACESMPTNTDEPLENLATKALLKMITTNHKAKKGFLSTRHRSAQENLQFGTLIQTLSVYLEQMSMSGCKSANERFGMVAGRVELLRSIGERAFESLSSEEKTFLEALKQFVMGEIDCNDLQHALDKAYDQHNLQGSHIHVCLEDSGASSKVQSTKNKNNPGSVTEINTNIAESALSNLSQSNAASLQSHKGMASRLQQFFNTKLPTENVIPVSAMKQGF